MRQLYVYTSVEVVSNAYHSGGGVMIVTCWDPKDVWAEWKMKHGIYCGEYSVPDLPDPAYTADIEGHEAVFIFPDSGCC